MNKKEIAQKIKEYIKDTKQAYLDRISALEGGAK
ncbi:MAG: hypothetical protein BWY74_00343 [Firmicutes bacterium ADurb.Bin419]|nr:MAG: hypothetical protein BWY74_00343 [Firmicutes bacterium ADurb.Bin419]